MNHPDPTAETLPNPYRFTVRVEWSDVKIDWAVVLTDGDWMFMEWAFPTKEEADTHAALILAALHEAVME